MKNKMKVVVAGQSGDGATRTVTDVLSPALARLNLMAGPTLVNLLSVIMSPDSVHTEFLISPELQISPGDDQIDLLVSLEPNTYRPNKAHRHNPLYDVKPNRISLIKFKDKIVSGGIIIYDSSKNEVPIEQLINDCQARQIKVFALPATIMAGEIGLERARNIVMVGAIIGAMDCPEALELVKQSLREKFASKGEDIIRKNIQALQAGYDRVRQIIGVNGWQLGYRIQPVVAEQRQELINVSGNEAFCLGALAAGVRFMSGYPISPASPQLSFMSSFLPKLGGFCHQASSELAAINEVIGAAATGVRAYTATSGPGLSLMIEAIGHAGMMEVPIVICNCQRKGPDTGAPTKTAQEDLNLACVGSHG